ncbi:MAG: hypothetical protein U0176_18965 [Bacteroidia bacterium]
MVISTFGGTAAAPNLLNAARSGWQINKQWLQVDLLKRLQAEGATHFALLQVDSMSQTLKATSGSDGEFHLAGNALAAADLSVGSQQLRVPDHSKRVWGRCHKVLDKAFEKQISPKRKQVPKCHFISAEAHRTALCYLLNAHWISSPPRP